eukprot:maker-scaffold69_size418775-snap-gene-2.27 protein:Tk03256 transcript:maker-scaffold69_size418775-snap-gene-2.27-mRNA-1 annotation:"immunoglobulin heavy chain cdr3"
MSRVQCLSHLLLLICLGQTASAFQIVRTSHQEQAELGQTITLTCQSDSYFEHCVWRHESEMCEFEWKRADNKVVKQRCSSRLFSRIEIIGDYSKHECAIEITNVAAADAGNWQCEMEDYIWGPARGASDRKVLPLKVPQDAPTATTPKSDDEVSKGRSISDGTDGLTSTTSTASPVDETEPTTTQSTTTLPPLAVSTQMPPSDMVEEYDGEVESDTESASDFGHPRIGLGEDAYVAIEDNPETEAPSSAIGVLTGCLIFLVLAALVAGFVVRRQRRRRLLLSEWKDIQIKNNSQPGNANPNCKVEMNTILDDVDDVTGPYDHDPEMNAVVGANMAYQGSRNLDFPDESKASSMRE